MNVKILGILIAMVAHQILGALWYSPLLFSNAWIKSIGKTPDDFKNQKGFATSFILSSLGGLVIACALGYLLYVFKVEQLWQAILLGIFLNIGFVISNSLVHAPFESKSFSLMLISRGFDLVTYTVMSIVLFYLG